MFTDILFHIGIGQEIHEWKKAAKNPPYVFIISSPLILTRNTNIWAWLSRYKFNYDSDAFPYPYDFTASFHCFDVVYIFPVSATQGSMVKFSL